MVEASCYSNSVVPIQFAGLPTKIGALLDTGAACCAISLDTLKQVKPGYVLDTRSCQTFNVANDQTMTTLGSIILPFSIEGNATSTLFQVFPKLNQRIILGRTWIKQHRAVINLASQKLSFENSFPLFTSNTCTLKAGEVCLLQVKLGNENAALFPNGMHGILEARHDDSVLHMPHIIDSVSTCNEGKMPVVVQNKSGMPLKIVKDVAIANFTPLAIEQLRSKDIYETMDAHPFGENDSVAEISKTDFVPQSNQSFLERFDFSNTKCTGEDLVRLKCVLAKHQKAFVNANGKIGCSTLPPYKITLNNNAKPICKQPYRLNPEMKKLVDKQLQQLLDQKIIEPAENLQFCSPLIAIKKGVKRSQKHMKKQGNEPQVRIILDTRYLNSQLCYPKHEITSLTSILDVLAEAKCMWYTVCDLKHGYFQVSLDPSCRDLTGFLYDNQALRFTRLIQGLSASPMAFTSRLTTIFRPYLGRFLCLYLDDCLIFSRSLDDHIRHIHMVLSKLEEYSLVLSPNKCTFATNSATFLAHEVSQTGIQPSNEHVKSVQCMPEPKNLAELRSQIGLFTFFHTFIPERGKLMAPLQRLCRKKVAFNWTSECSQNFQKLKEIVSSKPLLHHPRFDQTFHVQVDSSGQAISGVLLQICENTGKFVPISYASRGLTDNEMKRPIFENEALACVFAVTSFAHYLSHRKFILYCDNVAVKYLLTHTKKLSAKMTRWALYLAEFNFEIRYIKSSENKIADCLSRMPHQYSHSAADDTLDDFPFLPGIDNLSNIDPNGDSNVEEVGSFEGQYTPSDILSNHTCEYDHEFIMELNAITRAQAAQEEERQAEIEKENEFLARELPFSETEVVHTIPNVALNTENTKWRNKQLKASKTPKRLLVSSRELSEAANEAIKSDDVLDLSLNAIREAQLKDTFCSDLLLYLEQDILPPTAKRSRKCILREMNYVIANGCLWQLWNSYHAPDVQMRLVIPKSLQTKLIELVHTSNLGTHAGVTKTIQLLKSRYIWFGLHMDVRRFVGSCDTCLLSKNNQKLEQVQRTLFDFTLRPWERVAADYVGPVGASDRGYNHFCVVIDHFSSWVICWPAKDVSAKSFAENFYEKVSCVYGTPRTMLSDKGSAFTSLLWKHLAELLGCKRLLTNSFHPSTKGSVRELMELYQTC